MICMLLNKIENKKTYSWLKYSMIMKNTIKYNTWLKHKYWIGKIFSISLKFRRVNLKRNAKTSFT